MEELVEIDYEKLNRSQKLALFLILIGPEQASMIMQRLDDGQIELLCREITHFRMVPAAIQQNVIDEFSDIIGQGLSSVLGGARFAQKTLEMAKGDFKAASLLGRIAPIGDTSSVISEIAEMDVRQIFNLIKYEQAQTIAFVMSYLTPSKAAELLIMVHGEQREEVVERIGMMDTTTIDNMNKVVFSLRKHVDQKEQPALHDIGGVRLVADLLNRIEKTVSKGLLTKIEERNPTLGSQIQRKMFSFDDLIQLSTRDLQRVMREIESSDLVVALKAANDNLQRALLGAVSKRAAETLMEEMEMLGPVRLKDVEAAQDRIIQSVRSLEEDGEITLDKEGSDVLV